MLSFNILLLHLLIMVSACHSEFVDLKAKGYVITAEEDAASEQWRDYLYNQLSKRSADKEIIINGTLGDEIPEGYKQIHLEVAADLPHSYCIKHTKDIIHLRVQRKDISIWMSYQLIERISQEVKSIQADDLPPAYVVFKDQCRSFDFTYREPHYQPNTDPDYSAVIGTQNLDQEWPIWGHNLHKILIENDSIWAHSHGKLTKEQYCFSSDNLYQQIRTHIQEHYTEEGQDSLKFMIAPNDNKIACTCNRCQDLGNTEGNAASAVVYLLNKLAKDFPQHQFYTIVYHSVNKPSKYSLAPNAGIFFSSINLPKTAQLEGNPKYKEFQKQLKAWQLKTNRIYLWDYASNFDDYLTPIPTLSIFQEQLKHFKKAGIEGVFINASGYEYSSFDDLKTYVNSALLIQQDLSLEKLIHAYFAKFYPKSQQLLSAYYLSLEKDFLAKKKPYSLYLGFDDVERSYFKSANFLKLCQELTALAPTASKEEQERLNTLLGGFTYTQLQIAYTRGLQASGAFEIRNNQVKVKPATLSLVNELEKALDDGVLEVYKETDGAISQYIEQWRNYDGLNQAANSLKKEHILKLTDSKGDHYPTAILADGVLGFPSDFHQGWLTSNQDLFISFAAHAFEKKKSMEIRFLLNEKHAYTAPARLELWQNNKIMATIKQDGMTLQQDYATCRINLSNINPQLPCELKIFRINQQPARLGMDEIQVFPQ